MKITFRFFVSRLLKSELLRNASVLFSGTVAAQLISILLQPLLRRLFSPEAFGSFSVYISLVGIIGVIGSFRYDEAIVLPKKDKDAINILTLSLFISVSFNLLIFIVLLVWGKQIMGILNLPKEFSILILYLIPLGALLYNTYQSFNNWLIRKKGFLDITVAKVFRRGSEGLAQVGFALIKYAKGLILSDIIGQIINNITVIRKGIKHGFTFRLVSVMKMRFAVNKYSDFPRYNLIPSFMSTCSYMLPAIFINKFYSSEYTGYFDLTKLLLSIPLALVASSLSGVLLQQIAEKYKSKQSFINDLKPVLFVVCLICVLEVIIIFLFGISLFKFVFGSNWGMSGEISRILVWSFAFNFLVSSFSSIFISMRKIKTYGLWQAFYFVAILSLIFFKYLSFKDFLKVYVFLEIFCYTIISVVLLFIVSRYELSLRRKEINT